MRQRWHIFLPLIVIAAGCSLLKLDEKSVTFGRQFLGLLEAGDSTAIVARVDPSLTSYSAWESIAAFRDTLRAFHSDSTSLIGWNTFETPDSYRADLTYEMHGHGWALVAMRLVRRQDSLVVTALHLEHEKTSLAEANAFHFSGKSPKYYLVLAAAIISCLISLGTAIVLARTAMPRRWLWAFVALLGYGQFSLNWSTGDVGSTLLRVQLFGAAFVRNGLASPWIVSFSLPLGAAYALWRRHRFLTAGTGAERSVASVSHDAAAES